MLKTVKVKKQLRLDELIKYIFDNDIAGKRFEERTDYKSYSIIHAVHVTGEGVVKVEGLFNPDTTFTVEVEEEIDPYTVLENAVVVYKTNHDNEIRSGVGNKIKIIEILNGYGDTDILKIYTLLDGELQLIWEAE